VSVAARISQADMERAAKAVRSAGFPRARIVMRLDKNEIEVIIGESGEPVPEHNPWDDE
jgi:hypothetical protein